MNPLFLFAFLALVLTEVAASPVKPEVIVYQGPVLCTDDGKCAVVIESPAGVVLIPIPMVNLCEGEVKA